MKKIIRRIGKTSLGIIFDKEECEINNIQLDDIADLSDMVVIKNGK